MTQQYQSAVIELWTADRAAFINILTGYCKIFLQVNEVFKWRLKENLLSSFTIASLLFVLFLLFAFFFIIEKTDFGNLFSDVSLSMFLHYATQRLLKIQFQVCFWCQSNSCHIHRELYHRYIINHITVLDSVINQKRLHIYLYYMTVPNTDPYQTLTRDF